MTISLADAVKMYPSIKLATIRKAVIFSQENLPQQPKRHNQTLPGAHPFWEDQPWLILMESIKNTKGDKSKNMGKK